MVVLGDVVVVIEVGLGELTIIPDAVTDISVVIDECVEKGFPSI